jgi:hypothetical protein
LKIDIEVRNISDVPNSNWKSISCLNKRTEVGRKMSVVNVMTLLSEVCNSTALKLNAIAMSAENERLKHRAAKFC